MIIADHMGEAYHVLCRLQDLFKSDTSWIKGDFAKSDPDKDEDGVSWEVEATDKRAFCWCLQGGLEAVEGVPYFSQLLAERQYPALAKAALALSLTAHRLFPDRLAGEDKFQSHTIVKFNDHPDTTIADVRKVIEEAALMLQDINATPRVPASIPSAKTL